MKWNSPYIVVRPHESDLLYLNEFQTLRESRYYLQYLAQPNDAIFTTPLHEQYRGSGEPTYMCHLETRMDFNENAWLRELKVSTPYVFKKGDSVQTVYERKETQILDLSDKLPLNLNPQDLNLLFSEPMNWWEWKSVMRQKSSDVYIISVKADSAWPLTLKIESKSPKSDSSDIKFIIKPIPAF